MSIRIIFFLIIFLASVFGIAFASFYRIKKIAKLNGCMELNWDAIGRQNDNGKIIALIGDSRISQWYDPQLDPSFNIVNFGIAGTTSSELRCAVENLGSKAVADWYVISIGINDIVAASMLNDSERMVAEDAIVENVERIVDYFKDSGGRVVVLTIVPPYKLDLARKLIWGGGIDSKSELISSAIKKRLKGKAEILDMASVLFSGDENLVNLYFKDALHWTDEAYLKISYEVNKMIVGN